MTPFLLQSIDKFVTVITPLFFSLFLIITSLYLIT